MTTVAELVDLPDPAVQPRVHPLDLPAARPAWRRAWWWAVLTGPAVAVGVAVAVWFAGGQYVISALLGAAIIAVGLLVTPCMDDLAWAFIPRKRQDRNRKLPMRWRLGAHAIEALGWAVTMLLVAVRLTGSAVSTDARMTAFGIEAGCGLALLADLLLATRRERGAMLMRLPVAVSVCGSAAAGYLLLFGRSTAGFSPYSWSAMAATGALAALSVPVQNLTRRHRAQP